MTALIGGQIASWDTQKTHRLTTSVVAKVIFEHFIENKKKHNSLVVFFLDFNLAKSDLGNYANRLTVCVNVN